MDPNYVVHELSGEEPDAAEQKARLDGYLKGLEDDAAVAEDRPTAEQLNRFRRALEAKDRVRRGG